MEFTEQELDMLREIAKEAKIIREDLKAFADTNLTKSFMKTVSDDFHLQVNRICKSDEMMKD